MKHIFNSRITSPIIGRIAVLLGIFGCLIAYSSASAQTTTTTEVVVTGDDIGSAYDAPGAISRTQFAPLTTSYVLPPWTFYFGTIYEGDAFREGLPDHLFTEELELGLPHRFGIATELTFERFNGGGGPSSAALEARYAFADWGK